MSTTIEILSIVLAVIGLVGGAFGAVVSALLAYIIRLRDQEIQALAKKIDELNRWLHRVDVRLGRIEEAMSGVRRSQYDLDVEPLEATEPPPKRNY